VPAQGDFFEEATRGAPGRLSPHVSGDAADLTREATREPRMIEAERYRAGCRNWRVEMQFVRRRNVFREWSGLARKRPISIRIVIAGPAEGYG